MLGLIHIYTGNGKGKTTAAVGLALRAAGHGKKCHIIHFMKGVRVSGEDRALEAIDNISIKSLGLNLLGPNPPSVEDVKASLKPALEEAKSTVAGEFDIVVLDEIIVACSMGLLSEEDIITIIDTKKKTTELIMTGRGASDNLIQKADLVTEMRDVKHPFSKGTSSRPGIEF